MGNPESWSDTMEDGKLKWDHTWMKYRQTMSNFVVVFLQGIIIAILETQSTKTNRQRCWCLGIGEPKRK